MVEAGLLNPKSRWTRYTAGKSRELFYNHDVKKAGLSSYSREVPAGGYKDVQQLEATDFDPVYMYMIKQLVSAKKAAKVGEVIVTLAAIEKRPELNGLKAELVGFDAATGRYQVRRRLLLMLVLVLVLLVLLRLVVMLVLVVLTSACPPLGEAG